MTDTVGFLYVRVLADTKGLDRQIESEFTKFGNSAGAKFAEAFQKNQQGKAYFARLDRQAKTFFEDFRKQWQASGNTGDIIFDDLDVAAFDKFFASVRDEFDDLAENVEEDLVAAFSKAQEAAIRESQKATEEYSKAWDAAHREERKRVQKAADDYAKIWEAAHREDLRRTKKAADDFAKKWDTAHRENARRTKQAAEEFRRIWESAHREDVRRWSKIWDDAHREDARRTRRAAQEWTKIWNDAYAANAKFEADLRRKRERDDIAWAQQQATFINNTLRRVTEAQQRGIKIPVDIDTRELDRLLGRVRVRQSLLMRLRIDTDSIDDINDRIRVFSRTLQRSFRRMGTGGAFNAVTNVLGGLTGIVGGVARSFTRMGAVAGTAFDAISKNLTRVGKQLVETGGFASTAAGYMAQFGGSLAGAAAAAAGPIGIIAALGLIAAAASALILSIGALVSLIDALAGMLVIVGAAAFSALAGLSALVPVVLALGAGFAALLIGMKGVPDAIGAFNDVLDASNPEEEAEALEKYAEALGKLSPAAKDSVRAMEPLIRQFRDIRENVQEALFKDLADNIAKLEAPLAVVGTGLEVVASGLNAAFVGLAEIFSQQVFLDNLGASFESWGVIIGNVVLALGNFAAGLFGLFQVINPFAEEMSTSLLGISQRFKEWGEAAKNNPQIVEFFEKAWAAIKTVWDIVVTLTHAFGTLFVGAQDKGNGLLTTILDLATEFDEWVTQVSEDGRLKKWLDEAEVIARLLWGVVLEIWGVFQRLNTEDNREWLKKFIYYAGVAIDTLGVLISVAIQVAEVLVAPFQTAVGWIQQVVSWVKTLIGWLGKIKMPDLGGLGGIVKNFSRIPFLGAAGGLFSQPTNALIGEAGTEALIPLTRPLHLVDPSVRDMAAMLRGKAPSPAVSVPPGKIVNNTITVQTTASDPFAVATQIVNRAAAFA